MASSTSLAEEQQLIELFSSRQCVHCPAAKDQIKIIQKKHPSYLCLIYDVDKYEDRWRQYCGEDLYTPYLRVNGDYKTDPETLKEALSKSHSTKAQYNIGYIGTVDRDGILSLSYKLHGIIVGDYDPQILYIALTDRQCNVLSLYHTLLNEDGTIRVVVPKEATRIAAFIQNGKKLFVRDVTLWTIDRDAQSSETLRSLTRIRSEPSTAAAR